jgi:hypothetical protein
MRRSTVQRPFLSASIPWLRQRLFQAGANQLLTLGQSYKLFMATIYEKSWEAFQAYSNI